MLTDAEMEVLSARITSLEVSRAFIGKSSLIRRSEVGRTSEEPGNILSQNVERFAGSVSPRDPFRIGWEGRKVAVPVGGKLAPLHQFDLSRVIGVLSSINSKEFRPLPSSFSAARANTGREVFIDAVGHKKVFILGPPVGALTQANFVVSERLAVGRGRVLFMRRTVADVAVQNDEGGAVFRFSKRVNSVFNALDVVSVTDTQDVPVISQKSRRDVFGEGDLRFALDRDMIVVVDPTQV